MKFTAKLISVKLFDGFSEFCNIDRTINFDFMVKEITVSELAEMKENGEDFQLIDVREPHEREIASIEGELIPLATIAEAEDRISKDKKVIVYCRSGARSGKAVHFLQSKFGFDNLYNLKGGILAYADEIDPNITKY